MPDVELVPGPWLLALTYRGKHAWATADCPALVTGLPYTLGNLATRPYFESAPTQNWERKILRDGQERLPRCVRSRPGRLRTVYHGSLDRQEAWTAHLQLLDFYEALCDQLRSQRLWTALRKLCYDDLEYQYRAASLVRVTVSALAGYEEQWNGPEAKALFNDVVDASNQLRRALTRATQGFPIPPSATGFIESLARGPASAPPIPGTLPLSDFDVTDATGSDEPGATSLEAVGRSREREHVDRLLAEKGSVLRGEWEKFWLTAAHAGRFCDHVDESATSVRQAWANWETTERFEVTADPRQRKIGYVVSRLLRHLNLVFPSQPRPAGLVHVSVEVGYLMFGEDVRDRSYKALERIRRRGLATQ